MFGEDVGDLVGRWNIVNAKIILKNLVTKEMKVQFNVFCPGMEYWVCSQQEERARQCIVLGEDIESR